MPSEQDQTITYLFGLFSDQIDAVSLENTLRHYADSQQAFSALSSIIVSAVLSKLALLLEERDLHDLLSLLQSRTTKEKVWRWLDTHVPDATLQLAETAEMALFGITELQ